MLRPPWAPRPDFAATAPSALLKPNPPTMVPASNNAWFTFLYCPVRPFLSMFNAPATAQPPAREDTDGTDCVRVPVLLDMIDNCFCGGNYRSLSPSTPVEPIKADALVGIFDDPGIPFIARTSVDTIAKS